MIRGVFAAWLLLMSAAAVSAQVPTPLTNVIVTQGEATLKRSADRAWLTVEAEHPDLVTGRDRREKRVYSW